MKSEQHIKYVYASAAIYMKFRSVNKGKAIFKVTRGMRLTNHVKKKKRKVKAVLCLNNHVKKKKTVRGARLLTIWVKINLAKTLVKGVMR